jgi:aryl-alcohol dehydrogenase-like predicted oxidoreductase
VQTIAVPNTGLRVSRVCMGTMTFGSQADEAASRRMVDACLDAGIAFFDTANVYNDGDSERILGRIVRGRRERVVLATKVRNKWGEAADEQGLSRQAIVKAVDASLKRLDTDWLDICYFHQPDHGVPLEESLDAMDCLVKSGRVRYPALSNYAAWTVCHIHGLCVRGGFRPPYIGQPMYNLLARGIEAEYLPACRAMGVSNFVYNPLAGGLLTGKQNRAAPEPGTRFDSERLGRMYRDRYWRAPMFDAVERLKAAGAAHGRSLVSVALNWVLHHTAVEGLVLGASRVEQLKANLEALEEGRLPPQLIEECDRVWASLGGAAPQYFR